MNEEAQHMNDNSEIAPLCMYSITSLIEPKDTLKGTTVYGKIIEIGVKSPYKRSIYEDNDAKQWCQIQLLGVNIPKKSIQNCIKQPGYDYIRNSIKPLHNIRGTAVALLNLTNNITINSFVEIKNASWLRPYSNKANTYALSRWVYIEPKVYQLDALECNLLRFNPEVASKLRKYVDVKGEIIPLKIDKKRPICGEENDLPPRLAPRAEIVDNEYQRLQVTPNSLATNGTRYDGSVAAQLDFIQEGKDLGIADGKESNEYVVPSTNEVAFKRVEAKVIDREEFKEYDLTVLEEILEKAKEAKDVHYEKITEKAKEVYKEIEFDDEFYESIAENIRDYWDTKPSVFSLVGNASGIKKGKDIFIDAVSEAIPEVVKKESGSKSSPLEKWILLYGNRLANFLVNTNYMVASGSSPVVTEDIIYKNRYLVYLALLRDVLKIRVNLVKIANIVESKELLQYIIRRNPYLLAYIRSGTSLRDMDRLAMVTDNFGDAGQVYTRGIASLIGYMRGTITDRQTEGSIVYSRKQAEEKVKGATELTLTEGEYTLLCNNGIPFTVSNTVNLMYYVKPTLDIKETKNKILIDKSLWRRVDVGGKISYARAIARGKEQVYNTEHLLMTYTHTGMGVDILDKYIADTKLLDESLQIYKKLKEIQDVASSEKLDAKVINNYRIKFERKKRIELGIDDFHLEGKQVEALNLLHNGVMAITGLAGSGKTTVAEALVYMLINAYGVDEDKILFVAPTGKAANRLKETVKKPTSTIHRAFGIGVVSDDVDEMTYVNSANKDDIAPSVLIIDENSMIGTELMATLLDKVPSTTKIIFLGDIEQLPPISVGKPFSDILKFIPTVALDVVKRAAESSYITRNARQLIKEPTKDFVEGKDFTLVGCEASKISEEIKKMCIYYRDGGDAVKGVINSLGKIGLNEVQIISPFRVGKQAVGTERLNNELHNIFNPYKANTIKIMIGDPINHPTMKWLEYRVGDRVIHTQNAARKPHYKIDDKLNVSLIDGAEGVMNGDVGFIRYIENSQDLVLDSSINQDDLPVGANIYYIFVEYTGVNKDVYYIAYYINCKAVTDKVLRLGITALEDLDLAFALTVHKMQGSQARMIIIVWPTSGASLMTRNMLYTAITRAREGVTLIGDVTGADNRIKKSARIQAMSKRLSLMDIIDEI